MTAKTMIASAPVSCSRARSCTPHGASRTTQVTLPEFFPERIGRG